MIYQQPPIHPKIFLISLPLIEKPPPTTTTLVKIALAPSPQIAPHIHNTFHPNHFASSTTFTFALRATHTQFLSLHFICVCHSICSFFTFQPTRLLGVCYELHIEQISKFNVVLKPWSSSTPKDFVGYLCFFFKKNYFLHVCVWFLAPNFPKRCRICCIWWKSKLCSIPKHFGVWNLNGNE